MIQIGTSVGNFTIIAKLGEGAMATVFLAEHPQIRKRVAVKVILPELAQNQEMLSRFFMEARSVSQLHHDNVVEIQDFGQTPGGDNFIIMEYLEGRTLASLVSSQGRLPVSRALPIAMQIADALAAAHVHGVVHRDLKPDNIFLVRRAGTEDYVKVLDFGLAKLTGGSAMAQREHKTRTGSVLGTPHYMAPEQAEGRVDVDGRADVYSLGCILYRMLSGELPFPGEGFGEVLVKHLREMPRSVRERAPEVPPALEKVVLHCMAKKREYRFQSAAELQHALRDPERFSAYIGNDVRLLMGTYPGEPDVPPPLPPFQPALPAEAMATVIGGTGAAPMVPTQIPASSQSAGVSAYGRGAPVAAPEQQTIMSIPGAAGSFALPPPPQQQPGAAVSMPPRGGTLLVDPGSPPVMSNAGASFGAARGGGTMLADLSSAGLPPRPGPPTPRPPTGVNTGRRALIGGLAAFGVVVVAGAVVAPRLLRPKIYKVEIRSTPDKAQVLRDGQLLGETPLVLEMKKGQPPQYLTLRKDGYFELLRRKVEASDTPIPPFKLLEKPKPEPEAEPEEPKKVAEPEVPAPEPKKGRRGKPEPVAKKEPAAKKEPVAKKEPKKEPAAKKEPKEPKAPKPGKPKKPEKVIVPF